VGGCILALLGITALAAPLLAPYDPNARIGTPFSRPSVAYLLGTNDVGHDLLSELIYGARISLLIGIVAALAATLVGLTVGVAAGYARGWLDTVLMRLVDIVLGTPNTAAGTGDRSLPRSWAGQSNPGDLGGDLGFGGA
jgi:peptide/nickel transport system permease protein